MDKQIKCKITNNIYELELVYTDKEKNKWYALKDISTLPIKRAQVMLSRTNLAQMGLDEAFIKTCMKQINEYAKVGNLSAVKVLTEAFENRCDLKFNSKILMECASPALFVNDEDVTSYSQSQDKKKWEIWNKDQDCYDFFLSWAFNKSTDLYLNWHSSEETLQIATVKEKLLTAHLSNTLEQIKS
jgi:hypothetical protein